MPVYLVLLRLAVLPACLGALLGALIMFMLAGLKLFGAFGDAWTAGAGHAAAITAGVMGAIDAILFGLVLIFFGFAIAFSLIGAGDARTQARAPEWMHFRSLRDLKHTLIEVIIVYLVVDVATDISGSDEPLSWNALVKPAAITLIAISFRLMASSAQSSSER